MPKGIEPAVTEKGTNSVRDRDFIKLWAAETISLFGTQITELALPLTAVTVLHASAIQMGLLRMFGQAPFPLFSLFAGVWLDRIRRRPVLIVADFLRAVLLLSIPIAALMNELNLIQLYIVTFGVGSLTVAFEVAHFSYVPTLMPRNQLVESNSKLQVSYSVAELGGPGIAGLLTQLITAPFAVLANSFSYLFSGLMLGTMRTAEIKQPAKKNPSSVWRDIGEGMRALMGHPILQAIIISSVLSVTFSSALLSVYVLYLTRELHYSPATIGLIFAAGGSAAVIGAVFAKRAAAALGLGPAIISGWFVQGLARLLIPLAAGPSAMLTLITAQAFTGGAGTIANIHQWTFRQQVIPDRLLARVTASQRFLVFGSAAVGSLLGGVLGSWLGLHTTLWVCAVFSLMGPAYALFTPLCGLRQQSVVHSD
ncbi:MAG: MFS transporter [Anaerolineales bacterium]